jgi:hypothetical protein
MQAYKTHGAQGLCNAQFPALPEGHEPAKRICIIYRCLIHTAQRKEKYIICEGAKRNECRDSFRCLLWQSTETFHDKMSTFLTSVQVPYKSTQLNAHRLYEPNS